MTIPAPRNEDLITVYSAKRILTMDNARPEATHVAVKQGRVLGVGSLQELQMYGPNVIDNRFSDKVLMPGFVEGHSHIGEGSIWQRPYCGYYDRIDPEGRTWPGLCSLDAVISRLSQELLLQTAQDKFVVGWGFDPLFLVPSRRMLRYDLDQVSSQQPVAVHHASGHILNVNTAALEALDWLRNPPRHAGIVLDAENVPTGELQGPEVITPMLLKLGISRNQVATQDSSLRAFAKACVNAGVTTATELAHAAPESDLDRMLSLVDSEDFPVRLFWVMHIRGQTVQQTIARALAQKARSNDRLRFGSIKVHVDGSIQGFTARLNWPGYLNGENGLWYIEPEVLKALYSAALRAGLQVHTHTNGDQAVDMALDCIQAAMTDASSPDHRFTLQHCQMANSSQLQRMRALGVGVNFFVNHCFYWGDEHYKFTIGPDRAERMNPCMSALVHEVPLAIHSDAPVTPLAPLFTAWCAVNRITASGRTLGPAEKITVMDALRAITLGAAYSLKLDMEIGSIETGKRADFAVLEDDPLVVDPTRLKEVRVWGTVQSGRIFKASPRIGADGKAGV